MATPDIDGTDGDDQVFGTAGDNAVLRGLGGDDLLVGRGGNDGVTGDEIEVAIGSAADIIDFGNDTLFGGAGSDDLFGDADDLVVYGGGGEDLVVELGNDILADISTDPSFRQDLYGDAFELFGIVDGAEGGDAVIVAGDDMLIARLSFTFGDAYWSVINVSAGGASATLDLGNDTILGGYELHGESYGIDMIVDAAGMGTVLCGDDLLIAGNETMGLYGDALTLDVSVGGGGTGTIVFGNDTLVGGARNERMAGDFIAEFSTATGAVLVFGADTFVFAGDFGNDTITDFQGGLDSLRFEGFGAADYDDLVLTAAVDGLRVSLEALGGGTILLEGVAALAESDVIFV